MFKTGRQVGFGLQFIEEIILTHGFMQPLILLLLIFQQLFLAGLFGSGSVFFGSVVGFSLLIFRLRFFLLIEYFVILVVEIGVQLPDLVLSVPLFLLFDGLVSVGTCDTRLFLLFPSEPIVEILEVYVLVDGGNDLHVFFSPVLSDLSDLNFDDFCRIFTEVWPVEFVDEFSHDEAAFVLDEEGLDSLLLVPAELVGESKQLGHRFLNRGVQIMIVIQVEELAPLVQLLECLVIVTQHDVFVAELELLKALVKELEQNKNSIGVNE